ncbi:TIGR03087 family PEP-CTERM/XrtA system glycosyltransferase [Erythrobacter crassostreae]|uniref:TIGR03087 family PEP-CTERM/XrtA system glycosyltransferase n=1 Tax=Erythrobacter crassostreae TaxID=2828328 RepID=A0A9X1JNZ5_9SPHN|nr:TIGR03087 family PEP-CTERM/XrtA system glycosyltransferase [Erythrobacter crassostrea]MBV7260183.1 TIGR03087 family PEP-CTERM/XrtA system glycosyltransferase [Erythrobacter crassostrea]
MGDILFLAHRVPFPPNRGDKIRAHHLLRKLASIAPVHAGCFAESDEDRMGEAELQAICASRCVVNRSKPLVLAGAEAVLLNKPVSLTAFHSAKLQSWVCETIAAQNIATIVIFSGQMGQYVPDDFDGRVVIDLCDVDSAKFEGYAEAGERVWLNSREGRLLAAEEERLCKRSDTTILITENEAQLFRSRLKSSDGTNVTVLGNGIDAEFFDQKAVEGDAKIAARSGPHFTFTGQMDYRPNEQAALWVIDNFLPAARTVYPDAEFHIVGRNPTAKLLAHQGDPGLTIHGEVPDVRPFIAAADCVLAPLLIARGVQNKVLEAMAMAKPVLATPEAATGIPAGDGEHWMVCPADPEAMIKRVAATVMDPSANDRMGEKARAFVLKHHAWDAMLAPLETMVATGHAEARNAA